MNTIEKYNKEINFRNQIEKILKNDIDKYDMGIVYIIVTIDKIYPKLIQQFNYDFERLYNNISKLNSEISSGDVYKIHEDGNIKIDGYEKGYLFLTEYSLVLLHKHYNEKEYYKVICGDEDAVKKSCCNIGESHNIDKVSTPTIVRTYKYIPESKK